jgi:hypothetical protein
MGIRWLSYGEVAKEKVGNNTYCSRFFVKD